MIRINLLPVRQVKKVQAGQRQLALFLGLLAVELVALVLLHNATAAQIDDKRREVSKLETEIAALKQEVLSGSLRGSDALIEHGVRRQAGFDSGPTHIGQYQYGVKTGICLTKTPEGRLKMLVFTGESTPETAQGILYSGADVLVRNHRRLDQLKREHGFPHHLAVAMADISRELRELCDFYGIQFISPDQGGA